MTAWLLAASHVFISSSSFTARSLGFLALWDGAFLRPRMADGTFVEPFDPDSLTGSRLHSRGGAKRQRSGHANQ